MKNFMRMSIPLISIVWSVSALAFDVGPLTVGGAIRANYVSGDYAEDGSDAPQRGDNGGNFELDTFRINLDFQQDAYIGKAEYRWYNGYNFLHTGWLGYDADNWQVQVGLNRVPFGVGAYGPANSWFFDQHYYVGLSDDMDYGVKLTKAYGDLTVDVAYYLMAENSFQGASEESARYSYDIVDNGSPYSHYEERNQVNLRTVYSMDLSETAATDLGASLQWGQLDADEAFAEDSEAYAGSIHSKTTVGNWAMMLQLTQYKYDADYKDRATESAIVDEEGNVVKVAIPLSNDLITMGAYDFAWPVASEGVIPAVGLSYTWKQPVDFIDSITFYNDYSVIMKDGKDAEGRELNDSAMNVTGMAIARGGWYIYVDYAISDGNYFVGNEGDSYGGSYAESRVGDFGANLNDDWNGRFNINFGYYF